MSPIVALNLSNRRDIAGTECCSPSRKEDEKGGEHKEGATPANSGRRHLSEYTYLGSQTPKEKT